MHKRYKRWHAATVVTQIECDPDDPAFKNPTKPIGPFYTEEQAKEFMAEDPSKVFVEDSGRGWRRVVASPDPKKIVEADSILNLLDNEFIVIACGGGGIPVVRKDGKLYGRGTADDKGPAFPPSSTRTWAASCWPRTATLTSCSC